MGYTIGETGEKVYHHCDDKEYASKGVGTAGLTLGIIGTGLATLMGSNANGGNGLLSGILGGGNGNQQVSALMSEVAKLQSEKYTDIAISAQRDRLEALNEKVFGFLIDTEKRVSIIEATQPLYQKLTEQQIGCLAGSVASLANTLSAITKTIVPATAVCPQPMPLLNAWVAPTTPAAAA